MPRGRPLSMSRARAGWICAALFAIGLCLGLWWFGAAATVSQEDPAPPPWNVSLGSPPRFADVTAASGVDFRHENGMTGKCQYLEIMGAGVGVFDADGDADLDIYLVNGNRIEAPSPDITNRLFRNDGAWRFTDVTTRAGVGDPGYGQGCCAGDYDVDGDVDLYVSNYGPNVLYNNDGAGVFRDVTTAAGVGDPGWGQSSSFLDSDADGWPDLYVQNYLTFTAGAEGEAFLFVGGRKVIDYPTPLSYKGSASRLFRNQRDGTFRDVTEASGLLRPDGKGMGVACVDLNDDALVDIFVANDTAENFLFWGRKDARFQEGGLAAGVAFDGAGSPEASMGVDAGDFDNDHRLDLIVPCLRLQVHTLYRNAGSYFEDASASAGLAGPTSPWTGFNANFLDYDLDGDLDLFFTHGGVRINESAGPEASYNERYGMPDLLLANDGAGRYTDVSALAGPYFSLRLIGRGSAAADLDGDGDQDLVISNLADRAVVLRNDTAGGHWIAFDLKSKDGRRQPFGASVLIEAGGKKQRALVHGAVTYLSQGDPRPRFGLGAAAAVDRVEITWPRGGRQVLLNVAADRVVNVEEP